MIGCHQFSKLCRMAKSSEQDDRIAGVDWRNWTEGKDLKEWWERQVKLSLYFFIKIILFQETSLDAFTFESQLTILVPFEIKRDQSCKVWFSIKKFDQDKLDTVLSLKMKKHWIAEHKERRQGRSPGLQSWRGCNGHNKYKYKSR